MSEETTPPVGKKHAPRGRIKAYPVGEGDPMGRVCERCGQPHPRCKAHNKAGKPCGHQPIRGGAVCRLHGGRAPQVMLKAEERLKAMEIPALMRLDHWMMQDAFPSVSISAVKDALDRIRGKAIEQQILEHKGELTVKWKK